jgi:hypothetical protein
MKVLEYRFALLSDAQCLKVADDITAILGNLGETDFKAIYVSEIGQELPSRILVRLDEVSKILFYSLKASSATIINKYSDLKSIRSVNSCRFVCVELDNLIRICIAQDDDMPNFFPLKYDLCDNSKLLIETDLFDFM